MMAPGAFGLAAGMVLLLALKDKPEDAGAGFGVRGAQWAGEHVMCDNHASNGYQQEQACRLCSEATTG
jgi:hypothetical protein